MQLDARFATMNCVISCSSRVVELLLRVRIYGPWRCVRMARGGRYGASNGAIGEVMIFVEMGVGRGGDAASNNLSCCV